MRSSNDVPGNNEAFELAWRLSGRLVPSRSLISATGLFGVITSRIYGKSMHRSKFFEIFYSVTWYISLTGCPLCHFSPLFRSEFGM